MDEIATKAIIIGVSIFVTLIIITVIIFEFDIIKTTYKTVGETSISFENRLDEFDKYRDSNNIFSGLDVRNTVKKYENDNTVEVCIEDVCSDINILEPDYTRKFKASLESIGNIFRINFEEVL